jgi:hypothetical protein
MQSKGNRQVRKDADNETPVSFVGKGKVARPFANPYVTLAQYTRVNNHVFERILPNLSGNGLKILLVVLRQTWGYADPGSPSGRRRFDQISYSQFREKSGIKSDATVRRALQECLDAGCLLRKCVGADRRSGKPLYAYALNNALEVSASESKAPSPSDSKGLGSTEIKETQRKKEKDDGGDTPRKLALLTDFAMNLDQEVRALAARYSLPQIAHAISRARQHGQRNPQGLLRHWMRTGHMPLPSLKEQKHATASRRPPQPNEDARAFAAYRTAHGRPAGGSGV